MFQFQSSGACYTLEKASNPKPQHPRHDTKYLSGGQRPPPGGSSGGTGLLAGA